jgi:hypothetical protein
MKYFFYLPFVLFFASCIKSNPNCTIQGTTYSGMLTDTSNDSFSVTFMFRASDTVVYTLYPFPSYSNDGRYTNTCENVNISVWYFGVAIDQVKDSGNFKLTGVFLDNKTVINGNYINSDRPNEFGSFHLTKQ